MIPTNQHLMLGVSLSDISRCLSVHAREVLVPKCLCMHVCVHQCCAMLGESTSVFCQQNRHGDTREFIGASAAGFTL